MHQLLESAVARVRNGRYITGRLPVVLAVSD